MANIEDLRDRSVSSGTLKSEDLIPKFLGVLKTYGKDKYDEYIKENPEVEDWKNLDEETMGWVVDELTDLLNEIAPDGCYFGASDGDGADFGFWSMSNESKKSEADGNKDIFTLDLTRIDADGDEEGLDDMQAAQTFYDEDDAIKAAKELADSYKDDDGVVQVIVMAGEQEKPNGDIVGDSFDIYWASSSDKQTTADYRKKARYAAFDNKMDYYAKGGKSEGLPPKRLGSKRQYRSRADLINKMKQLGAVEITTSKQFNDIKNSQWLHTAGYALDTNGNLVAQSYYGDKDGKWYYTSTRNFDSDYLPESKQHENRTKEEEVTNIFKGMKEWADRWSNSDKDRKTIADNLDLDAVQENMSDIVEILDNNFEWDGYGFKFVVVGDYEDDDTRDEAEANQWNRCYDVCEEIADLIGIPDDVIGEMNIYFWEEIEADWRDDDSKPAESKKSEDTKVGKFTIMPKDTSKKQAGIRAYQTRLGEMGFKSNLHNNGDYIHDYVKEIGKIPGATVYVGTIDNFQKNTQEYQYEAELYMENEKGIRSNIEYMPFAITDISDGTQRKMYFNRLNALINKGTDFVNNYEPSEPRKKSESLTLKQKELKDMARFGQAEDITTISDAEAKELKKKGIETIGVSRGTYGMNGALLRDNEGNKYVITARSSNLFYFV